MMLDLGQIFAQTKGGWDSAMLTLVQWIVETILDFFEPIRDFFYFIFIYAPLQVIDVLVKIFKFFTNGFMSYLFFYQTNPDGSSVYSFKPNSSFYTVVIVILMISLIVFFINFLLKFREVRIVDEDGQPTVNQRSRLFQLKWPILMFLILIFTPFILTFVDSTISAIISAFNNDVPKALDSDTVERFDMESYELLGQYSRMLQYVVFTDLSGMTLSSYIDVSRTNIESLITQIDAARDQLQPADFALSLQFQRLELYLNRIKSTFNALTNSIKYIQTALADPFYADDEIGDTIAFNDMYVTDSLGRFLKNLGGQIQALQSACYQLNTVHTQIMDDTLSKNFAERYGSAYPTIAQDWNTELTYLQAFTDDLTYEVLASTKINFYVSPSSGSIAWRFLDPSSDINIYEFASHNKYGSGASIVKLIFSIVTGRPYYHWDDTVDPSIFADLSVYRIFFGSIMCWGFVMIMYTYVDFSIKRVFLMIYAWSIGWLYLAQGINKPEIPKKWYRALYGRWYSIIFLYLMFNAAEIVFSIIIPQIEIEVSSLDQIALQNFNIATSIGLMFACESIFTVFFQVVNSVDKQIYGVTDRNFSAQGSTFFGAGKKLFESSKSYYEQNLRNPLIKDWWNKPAEQVSKYQKQRDWRAANVGRISFGKEKDISGKKTGKWGITFHPGSKSIQSENVNAAYATRMAGAAKKRKELMAKPHLMQQDQHGNQVWKVPKSAKWTGTNLTGNGEVDNSWGNRFFNRMIRGQTDHLEFEYYDRTFKSKAEAEAFQIHMVAKEATDKQIANYEKAHPKHKLNDNEKEAMLYHTERSFGLAYKNGLETEIIAENMDIYAKNTMYQARNNAFDPSTDPTIIPPDVDPNYPNGNPMLNRHGVHEHGSRSKNARYLAEADRSYANEVWGPQASQHYGNMFGNGEEYENDPNTPWQEQPQFREILDPQYVPKETGVSAKDCLNGWREQSEQHVLNMGAYETSTTGRNFNLVNFVDERRDLKNMDVTAHLDRYFNYKPDLDYLKQLSAQNKAANANTNGQFQDDDQGDDGGDDGGDD